MIAKREAVQAERQAVSGGQTPAELAHWARLPAEAVLAELGSSPGGLSHAEAAARLQRFGRNEPPRPGRRPWALQLAAELTHFFALLLWAGAGLAWVAGMPQLAWAIVAVILINGLFSFWQEYQAERAVEALQALLPRRVTVRREGEAQLVSAAEVVPGDVLLLEEGEAIPADARLLEVERLRVDLSSLTGESRPVPRVAEALDSQRRALAELSNLVFAGSVVASGRGEAVVFATGTRTEFGRIARLTQVQAERPSPLQQEIAAITRCVTVLAVGLGVLFFVVGTALGGLPLAAAFLFGIGIIVANVPEGLLPTLTLSLALGVRRMAARNALVKHLGAVDTLGATPVILTDKTGTLTENELTVRVVWAGGVRYALSGVGYEPSGEVSPRPEDQADPTLLRETLRAAALCCDAHLLPPGDGRPRWQVLGDPTEGAILVAAAKVGLTREALAAWPRLAELPFDSAPRDRDGWRVDEVETDLTLLGLLAMEDPPRPEGSPALAACHEAGIRVVMVTGDHGLTAAAIGREIGLFHGEPRVVNGVDLDAMDDAALDRLLDSPELVFARATPEHKLRRVEAFQRRGEVVAVTGDGVNDAPALKRADIGVAMGVAGTDVAREAADMVLADDNFASIVAAIEEGRAVFDNIRKFVTYIFASNVPEIVPFVAFVLFSIPLPLTVMQILAVDLGTDLLPALALGMERPEPGVMRRPPRRRSERILTLPTLLRAYAWLGMIEAALAMLAFFAAYWLAGWQPGQPMADSGPLYLTATTMTLAGIVTCQMGNVFACRSPHESILRLGGLSNRAILLGLGVELGLLLALVYLPPLEWVFGLAPLAPQHWLLLAPFGPLLLLLEEARKALLRRLHAPPGRGSG